MTTDSFVVKPIRFPGGSIGELAVNGTVNDLAVVGRAPAGAHPVADPGGGPAGRRAAGRGRGDRRGRGGGRACAIVAGDTKVVERGHADEMYVVHDGDRAARPARELSPVALRPGDRILVSGRSASTAPRSCSPAASSSSSAEIESDTRCLWPAVDALLDEAGRALRCMRDATRGGVASVLNELARAVGVAMIVREAASPCDPAVAGAAEILGIDPMYVANEGKLVAVRRPGGRRRGPGRAARRAGLRGRGGHRRGQDRTAGDGAGGDRVWRQASHGPARGRSAAADLLTTRRGAHGERSSSYPAQPRRRRSLLTSSG